MARLSALALILVAGCSGPRPPEVPLDETRAIISCPDISESCPTVDPRTPDQRLGCCGYAGGRP